MPFQQIEPDLFQWTDTCNVYVLRDGDAALLFDLGDGSVLGHLNELGIKHVEWVLFTHHHREQCQGAAKIAAETQVAVPALERPLFETPLAYRKMNPTLEDAFAVHGASYVRPPIESVRVTRTFAKMDDFTWRGREIWCIHTGGNSPGHMTYLLRGKAGWIAVSGDLMLAGAKMHTWYDTEWDYGFAKGLYELGNSAAQIAGYEPALLLPAHGPIVRAAKPMLDEYIAKLRHFGELYVRGYDIFRFANCDQDNVSRPTTVPHVWQVTPHLFKFRGPDYWVNFSMLLADSGHALLIDCGLFDIEFFDRAIERMQQRMGLKTIDAIFVTHMHGDHALDANHVRKKYGAKLWAMEGVVDKFERPYDYDLCALLPSYTNRGKAVGPLSFDRTLRDGETFEWQGYTLTVDWMPGQTKYHSCLHGEIDGKRVAFTGDNLFASTTDPKQGGNEAVVARNGGSLEEGYLYAAKYLHGLGPDLLLGGHCWALAEPTQLVERYRERMEKLRAAFVSLSVESDYRYMYDPYWVQPLPYRVTVPPGGKATLELIVRNFRPQSQTHRVELHLPAGLSAEPAVVEGTLPGEGSKTHSISVRAAADAPPGMRMVALDITRDGQRHGELFDFLVDVRES